MDGCIVDEDESEGMGCARFSWSTKIEEERFVGWDVPGSSLPEEIYT